MQKTPVETKPIEEISKVLELTPNPTIASITASKKITWKSESSADINKWIEAYRNGDPSGGHKLIVKFTPLMRKYKALLKGGNVSTGGDIGRFLSFFGRDKKKVADLLSKSLSVYSDSEIDALLNYCLLYTAIKYLKISAGFKFVLKGEVVKLTKDAATHRSTVPLDVSDEVNYLKLLTENPQSFRTKESEYDSELQFISMGSSIPGFDILTENERKIAVLLFLQGNTMADVGAITEKSVESIRAIKMMIIKKLEIHNLEKK